VLAVGIVGADSARFQAPGMARALVATALAQTLVAVIAVLAGFGYTFGTSTLIRCGPARRSESEGRGARLARAPRCTARAHRAASGPVEDGEESTLFAQSPLSSRRVL
jgi:hypothetical protein